jgi:hypothetical protein
MDEVKIFVSHNSKYIDIAKSLKLSLQALESKTLLDIKISEEMAGSTDWRQWIEGKCPGLGYLCIAVSIR